MKTFETLAEAILDLKARGYQNDFNLQPDQVACPTINLTLGPDEFHVDEFYRFEGESSADDNSILFAIRSKSGIKGILVDAYGAYSDSLSPEMIRALTIDDSTIGH